MKARQDGFTIVEVVVALVMLAIVLTSLAGLSVAAAGAGMRNADATTRQAHSLELANRYMTLPYAAVQGANWCDTVGTAGNAFSRCVLTVAAGVTDTVVITVTPLQRNRQPETVRLVRTRP